MFKVIILLIAFCLASCTKIEKYNQPELESLQQALKTTSAIGYCASVVNLAKRGMALPENVIHNSNTQLIYIRIDKEHPLPCNNCIGDIILSYHWGMNGGIMSVLFADINIIGGTIKIFGIYAVPLMVTDNSDCIQAVVAKQDIIIGNGSDTILNLGSISDAMFNVRLNHLNTEKPTDTFVAVRQNFWFLNVRQHNSSNLYDDDIQVSGGGQIVEAKGETGGIVYHGMIDVRMNSSVCNLNPISGYALSQNFKAGGESQIDLGNSLLSFRNRCDGKVHVELSTGKYFYYNNRDIYLNLN